MIQLQHLAIAPAQISAQQIALTTAQQHYLGRVLRLRAGDRFIAIDGKGHWWLSVLTSGLAAEILEPIQAQTELPISVTLLIALPKTGMDDVVRQATELGVTQIVPILSDRTVLNPSSQKRDRWQRIAQEAAEQSERQIIPDVMAPKSWAEALQIWNSENSICYICAERSGRSPLLQALESVREQDLSQHRPVELSAELSSLEPIALEPIALEPIALEPIALEPIASAITIATGCEGGWTDSEIAQAIALGYQPVSLGTRILRAITAPLVALSLVASVFEAMPPPDKTI
ncbi:MAG: 16S rRNA (uracil(1498)-N(3))-methyltransferase [Leptolyngbyaceae cyanobacterium CRU_2_3]|nr:16S rRNA (uracil(1498)-N(3))-methyltransferase [Leptolyngbyaceae cyanobacterium CRU_2_3]